MTKKETLKWRLSKLPSSEEVLALVKDRVITKEEAKEILFSTEKEGERDEKSLKEEIKFLRDLVEKLSNQQTTKIIKVIKEVEKSYYHRPWYTPYYHWSGGGGGYLTGLNKDMVSCGTGSTDLSAGNSLSSASSLNSAFSSIKTF